MKSVVSCAWGAICALVLAAGAPSVDRYTAPDSLDTQATREHVVQPNETLSTISKDYYGSAQQWPRIAKANGITDPRKVHPGMRLVIPPMTGPVPPAPSVTAPEAGHPGTAEPPSMAPSSPGFGGLGSDFRQWGRHLSERGPPWWGWVLAVLLAFAADVFAFWIGSNIVHMQHMNVGRAAICSVFMFLLMLGYLVVCLLIVAAGALTWATARPWMLVVAGVVAIIAALIGSLILIKIVYRETTGKVIALAVMHQVVVAWCLNPLGIGIAILTFCGAATP